MHHALHIRFVETRTPCCSCRGAGVLAQLLAGVRVGIMVQCLRSCRHKTVTYLVYQSKRDGGVWRSAAVWFAVPGHSRRTVYTSTFTGSHAQAHGGRRMGGLTSPHYEHHYEYLQKRHSPHAESASFATPHSKAPEAVITAADDATARAQHRRREDGCGQSV